MSRQQIAAVFDTGRTFEPAFQQIAAHADHGQNQADQNRFEPTGFKSQPTGFPYDGHVHGNAQCAADRTFPAFTRTDGRRNFTLAKRLATEIRANIGHPHQAHNRQ